MIMQEKINSMIKLKKARFRSNNFKSHKSKYGKITQKRVDKMFLAKVENKDKNTSCLL